jgi:DNA-binding GntR family transcriptional regulator
MPTVGTKADDIALTLEEAIVAGEIAPGTVLRQEQLSEQFQVSRTPVREALRRLAALGLVSFVPNRGVRVRTLSRDELREAFLVRAELEGLATELATPRITEEGLEALDRAEKHFAQLTLQLRRRSRDGSQDGALVASWVSANHAFHDVIYAAADAPFVERLAKSARRSFFTHIVWAAGLDIDHLYEQNDAQHRAIREAIAARSAQGARVLAREHVLASGRLLETILDQVQDRQTSELRTA